MARTNLTPRFIESRKPAPSGQRLDYPDAQVPGMALRVTDRGHKSFVLIARYPLQPKHPTRRALGDYVTTPSDSGRAADGPVSVAPSPVGLADARARARRWLDLIAQGKDPKIEADRERTATIKKQANSVAAVIKDFLDLADTKKFAKFKDCEKCLNDFIERYGKRPITDLTTHEVTAAIKPIKDRGAIYQAHNYAGYVRQLLNWASAVGNPYGLAAGSSPMLGLDLERLIGKRESRDRVLKDFELRLVWGAAGELGYPYGPLVRLLILNAQREREDADLSWPEIDLDQKHIIISAARMKSDRSHLVPIAPDALEIFQELNKKRLNPPADRKAITAAKNRGIVPLWDKGNYVFSTMRGEKPVNGFSKVKDRIDVIMTRRGEGNAVPQPSTLDIEKIKGGNIRIVASGARTFKEEDVGRVIGIRHGEEWGYARLTDFSSQNAVEARVVAPFDRLAQSAVWIWGLEAWVWHDLRRTARTNFSALPKVQDNVRELVIAHAPKKLHKTYDLFEYESEKLECLTLWEKRLRGILSPPPPADVADLDSERAKREGKR